MDSEERKIWQRYGKARALSTRTRLRNELVERYLPIAARLAAKYSSRTPDQVEYDDIYSAGYQGLLDAIPRFKLARQVQPTTYLSFRVQGAILDFLRSEDSIGRLDRNRWKRVHRWEEEELGRKATPDEIDDHFGFSLVQPIVSSLDRPLYAHSTSKALSIHDTIADSHPNDQEGLNGLSYLLRGLSKRERMIVVLYHIEKHSMKQVAEQLGISESRVSQMMGGLIERVRSNAA